MIKKKVLVWLSGWVDSAVSAYLLQQAWYEVDAGFMVNYIAEDESTCTTKKDLEIAKEVASFLWINFFTFDYVKEYEEKILHYIFEWYQKWITPNPDVFCNSEVKFKLFLEEALGLWYDYIATGHYAKLEKDEKNIFHLLKWIDSGKDQSYFLSFLNQFQLEHSLFPIGNLEKSEVREIAKKIGLPNAERKDSQGLCFVGKVDFKEFLEKKIPHQKGNIIDTSGKKVGEHEGVFYYTIGQRKGLNIGGLKDPLFVIEKQAEKNILIVGTEKDLELYNNILTCSSLHFVAEQFEFPKSWKAKIRYRQADQDCTLSFENGKYIFRFDEKQRAITSGQVVAFYLGDELVASGVID